MEYYDTCTGYQMWMNYNQTKIPSPMNLRFNETPPPPPTALPFGGFAWPPRSYTCSFCKREFRSAQALGGHMNVHRRDRARVLNQSDSAPAAIDDGKLVESKLVSIRRSCSVVVDEDTTIVQCKRYKVSEHEIDLELRLGSDPQLVK